MENAGFRSLLAQLPFALEDTDRVNHVYAHWRTTGDEDALRQTDLWTYCYIRRYFLVKFTANRALPVADLDALEAKAFRLACAERENVEQPGHYAHWVSVLCKNTFYNYYRSQRARHFKPIDPNRHTAPVSPEAHTDLMALLGLVERAIGRLPRHLQEVARLRFLEECTYTEIAEITQYAPPTVRTYVSKSAAHLREDRALAPYLAEYRPQM